ncbi:MAG: hypothetical protein ABI333_20800 [bacterium]
MKQIRPSQRYNDHTGYPSAIDERFSRRTFLRATLTGAAAMGGLLIAGRGLSRSRKSQLYRATIRMSQTYRFRYGNYQVDRLVVQTTDHKLALFLAQKREAPGIEKGVRAVLDGHSCVDLKDGRKLARLQRLLGKALAKHHRTRTRRTVAAPTVILFVGLPGVRCLGDCAPPVPFCKPPGPKRPRRRR